MPKGVKLADAEEIVEQQFLGRFKVMGQASIAHFADYFRCCLFKKNGSAWVDTDALCLRPFSIDEEKTFLAKETPILLGNAILRIDPSDVVLPKLIRAIEKMANERDQYYGASGPILLTKMYGEAGLADAFEPKLFFPISSDRWLTPFLPSERDACERACTGSNVLHVWNNSVARSGIWKDLLPPRGSFLNEELTKMGLDVLFQGTYPEEVMDAVARNNQLLQTASHVRILSLMNIVARRLLAYPLKQLKTQR
jgi:hypothetical protein